MLPVCMSVVWLTLFPKTESASILQSGAAYMMSTFLAHAARKEGITVLSHLVIGRLRCKHATSLTESLMDR